MSRYRPVTPGELLDLVRRRWEYHVALDQEWRVPPPLTADEVLRHELVAATLQRWQREWLKAGR